MISNREFNDNIFAAASLSEKLKERVFLKTQLDVVYTDLVNWERAGLLLIGGNAEKGDWKKLNYIEYVWLKIIEELRLYGFTYEEINEIKEHLFHQVTSEELSIAKSLDSDNVQEKIDSDKLAAYDSYIETNPSSVDFDMTLFELMIMEVIINTESLSILFFKDSPGVFLPISTESFRGFEKIEILEQVQELFNKTFVSISLSNIIAKFLHDGEGAFEKRTISILTKEEHTLLKHVRKRYDNIKSIKIRFVDNNMELIEINTVKKAKLESRLMEHIKKGDYLNISIDTMDGKIVNFENTQKIKL